MNQDFNEAYEEINNIILESLINDKKNEISHNLIERLNSTRNIYNHQKKKDIDDYLKSPNIEYFEYLINKYKNDSKLTSLNNKEINKIRTYILKNINSYEINKHNKLSIDIFKIIEKNNLYKKYKNKIFFHLNSNVKGYRTLYYPIKHECHIVGNFKGTLKDVSFIFHELGHCFQLLSTKDFLLDYTIAEIYSCANEVLMSKNTCLDTFIIKFINNKILESMCMFDFYMYIYKQNVFSKGKIEDKWKNLCQKYNINYKPYRYLFDLNCLDKPQNILSYTISYLISLQFVKKEYKHFNMICEKGIDIKQILEIINSL